MMSPGSNSAQNGEGSPLSVEELAAVEADVDVWLEDQLQTNPTVLTVDRGEPGQRRWHVRMVGEEKTVSTVWLTLGQRQLHCECHFMPAPEENEGRLYEYLLRRNRELTGLRFAIGAEDAVYLVAELPARAVTEAGIDRLLGSFYAYSERWFRPCMRIGYQTRFKA